MLGNEMEISYAHPSLGHLVFGLQSLFLVIYMSLI